MKKYLFIAWLCLIPFINYSQTEDHPKGFGFALKSSFNGELDPIRFVPSVVYFKKNNQFELGVGFNPFGRDSQKQLSTEFNYKYFPNGFGKKFNMFLIVRASYVNSIGRTYYPTTYNYLFLNGGYGFEVIPFKNAFIGTNVTLGGYTYNKKSDIPYNAFESQKFFDELGMTLAFQFSIGYRL
jgi:hypothetical protein